MALAKRERPDVILCDIAMPEHDGYWLLRRLRALSAGEGGEIPVAALTAHASEAARKEVLAAGFQAHLVKPTDPSASSER
jgi:two-component system, chemotaxis family, CheB/CheR fusion protein